MIEKGEAIMVLTLSGPGFAGVWLCQDQEAINETIHDVVLDHCENQYQNWVGVGVVIDMMMSAKTDKELTGARIEFEKKFDMEFDISTQRVWAQQTAIDVMKESVDA